MPNFFELIRKTVIDTNPCVVICARVQIPFFFWWNRHRRDIPFFLHHTTDNNTAHHRTAQHTTTRDNTQHQQHHTTRKYITHHTLPLSLRRERELRPDVWFSHETLRAVRLVARPLDYPFVSSWTTRRIQWGYADGTSLSCPCFFLILLVHTPSNRTASACGKKKREKSEGHLR